MNKLRLYLIMIPMALILACSQAAKDQETLSRTSVEESQNEPAEPIVAQPVEPSLYPVEETIVLEKESLSRGKNESKKSFYADSATSLPMRNQAAKAFPESKLLGTLATESPNIFIPEQTNRENYEAHDTNPIHLVSEQPVSTFSIDVDTASYANVRRILNGGSLPPSDAVRVEEFINYFTYQYPIPKSDQAFSVNTELGPSPWNKDKYLLHIGLQGYKLVKEQRDPSNLVFLLDVSGSMDSPNKLPLLKNSLRLLLRQMNKEDSIGIVVYAGAAGVVLEPTSDVYKVEQALDQLHAGGSTNGGAGIEAAYRLAQQAFKSQGNNRVILCTDGDFNVGTVNQRALKDLIEQKRRSGIGLTVLSFGMGNYNDALMQSLAQHGNGNAFYIDTLQEARKVLVEEMSGTLHTIAKDVKIQVEFNPSQVAEYRLIGYETRALKREDFNNDKVDAGEIGAGHSVTALYELTLVGSKGRSLDPLRYSNNSSRRAEEATKSLNPNKKPFSPNKKPLDPNDGELAFLRLRHKKPDSEKSQLLEQPIYLRDIQQELKATSDNFRFSAAVAGFAELLKGGKYNQDFSYKDVLALIQRSKGEDRFGYRGELQQTVALADSLQTRKLGHR